MRHLKQHGLVCANGEVGILRLPHEKENTLPMPSSYRAMAPPYFDVWDTETFCKDTGASTGTCQLSGCFVNQENEKLLEVFNFRPDKLEDDYDTHEERDENIERLCAQEFWKWIHVLRAKYKLVHDYAIKMTQADITRF